MSQSRKLKTVGLLLSARLFLAVSRRGKTSRKRSRTSKKPSLRGSGLRTKKPWLSPRARANPKPSYPFNQAQRLANISGQDAVRAFEQAGWQALGQVESHLVITRPGMRVNLSIPWHKELSIGTLRVLIRRAGMTMDEFLRLL